MECKCGRAIRWEQGKQAEVFMLVLRGTVEENWAKKAAENQSIIEINEDELNKVLNNENLDKEAKKQEVFKYDLLRF